MLTMFPFLFFKKWVLSSSLEGLCHIQYPIPDPFHEGHQAFHLKKELFSTLVHSEILQSVQLYIFKSFRMCTKVPPQKQ